MILESKGNLVLWVDNFNKNHGQFHVNPGEGAFIANNWTVHACRVAHTTSPSSRIDMSIGENKLPLWPELEQFAQTVWENINKICNRANSRIKFDQVDWTQKFLITRLPLKVTLSQREKIANPDIEEKMKACSLYGFWPLGLDPDNIGSNRGIASLLKKLMDEQEAAGNKYFKIVLSDCNIFARLYKVTINSYKSHCSFLRTLDIYDICVYHPG